MKRIMKKALSLALAVVMMLTLAPVATKAAETKNLNADGSFSSFTYDGFEDCKYLYTPETDGTLTIEFGSYDWICYIYEGETLNMSSKQVLATSGAQLTEEQKPNKAVAELKAGQTYLVLFRLETKGDCMFIASFRGTGNGGNNGAGTETDPLVLESGATLELGGMQEVYCKIPATNGVEYTLTVKGSGMMEAFEVAKFDPRTGWSFAAMSQMGQPAKATVMGMDSCVFIKITETGRMGANVTITLEEAGKETGTVGTEENPDTLPVNDEINGGAPVQLIPNSKNLHFYYYTWTAPATGMLSMAMISRNCTDYSWNYAVMGGEWETLMLNSVDNEQQNPGVYYVHEGEEITVWVAMPEYGPGQVSFVASFETCEYPKIELPKFTTIYDFDDKPYLMAVDSLVVGDNEINVSNEYVTLYEFVAEEHAVYTFTVADGFLGQWATGASYGTTGKLVDPESEVKTVEVELKAYESVILGVTGVEVPEDKVSTTTAMVVEQGATIQDKKDVEYTDAWFVGTSPEPYTFTGDVAELEFIDIEDEVNDFIKNVYPASDGFYHFGSKTGPVILVDLDGVYDWMNPLVTAENKALKGEDADGDGKAFNYSDLYKFYAAIADKETKLYPLNDDLIDIYMDGGKAQGWYAESVGGITTADGWMFNCCYVPAKEVAPEGGSGSGESEKEPEKEPVKVEVPADKVIAESALGTAIQEAVANNAPLVVETTTEGVTLTFAPADLKDAEAVKLNVEVKLDVDVKDETVAKNDDITADNFVLKVEFSHDGKLPAKATITIPVLAKFANKTLFYYEILADGTLKFVCDAPVDADGNAKVTQDHCSDYVLLTEKVAEAPKTGDNTNFALWIAVLGLGVVAIAGSVVMKKREF